jgi:hypothetical protein
LPLDANLRRANAKSRVVKDIIQTLTQKPQDFLKSNLGIVLIVEKAHFKYDAAGNPTGLWVEMLSGLHGVANGAHTLSAIHQAWQGNADLSEAYVVIRVNVGVSDEVVRSAVVHLNTAEKVDRRSILYKYGQLDYLKVGLDDMGFVAINYYQNQAKAENRREDTRQSIVHIIKLLTAVDRERFNADINQHPVSIVGGGSGIMEPKTIERAEALLYEFFPVIVRLEKAICQKAAANPRKLPGIKESTDQDSLMVDGTPIRCKIPSVFALPVVAALRAFIDEDKWQLPMDEILPEVVEVLWKEYSTYLKKEWEKDRRNIGGILRNEEVWILLYNAARSYYIHFLKNTVARSADLNGRSPTPEPEKSKK